MASRVYRGYLMPTVDSALAEYASFLYASLKMVTRGTWLELFVSIHTGFSLKCQWHQSYPIYVPQVKSIFSLFFLVFIWYGCKWVSHFVFYTCVISCSFFIFHSSCLYVRNVVTHNNRQIKQLVIALIVLQPNSHRIKFMFKFPMFGYWLSENKHLLLQWLIKSLYHSVADTAK